ncbi:MAG: cytochrome c oxidase subunit II [Hyphomicrobiales bacterium]
MKTETGNFIQGVDLAFYIIIGISVILLLGLTGAMIYFVYRFNKKRHPKARDIKESKKLEILWITIPTVLVLVMFYFGWAGYAPMRDFPDEAIPIQATGRMWSWNFEYENGKNSSELVVPVNYPVKLDLYSPDVLHSLYIPAFRIKEDVVPGVNNAMWFQADAIGDFDILCAEYCGLQHSNMLTKVRVLSSEDYDKWYNSKEDEDISARPGAAGLKLLQVNGCIGCHSTDGTKLVGPSFKALWGTKQMVTSKGMKREVIVDKQYIITSIYEPNNDIPEGYNPNIMVSYKGKITEKDIDEIITYLKTIDGK